MTIDKHDVGKYIQTRRKQKGYTQAKLASAIGKSISSVQKYESGAISAPLDVIGDICNALGCELILLENNMTIEELINRINAHRDPDPDSDWKYGKDYGIMVALKEIERYQKYNETHHGEQPEVH